MSTYILLRNNKESGPLELSQLKELGLKANDLIWVEGQSASWRNPHEIRELAEFAGQQPKPVEKTPVYQETVESGEIPATADTTPQPRKKAVFVALPEKQPVAVTEKKQTSIVQASNPVYSPLPEPVAEEKKPDQLETKYAMSLDEIKDRYIKSLEDRKKPSKKFSFKIPKEISRAAVYVGLVGLGATIVLLVMKKSVVSPMSRQQHGLPSQFESRPAVNSDDGVPEVSAEQTIPESYFDTQTSPSSKTRPSTTTVKKSQKTLTDPEKEFGMTDDNSEEESTADAEDRISIPKNETPEIRTVKASDIADQVSVKTNSYTIAALGGIRDLELTLRNDSRYTLDKVTVEVRFLNPNGNIVRTEDVHFKSIKPSGIQTIGMKKTNRGVKVSYKVIRIESREIGTQTAGL